MANELSNADTTAQRTNISIDQAEDNARVLILGGLEACADAFSADESLQALWNAQDLRVGALHQSDASALAWLKEAGVDILSLCAMRGAVQAPALPEHMRTLGFGETEAEANRPLVLCVNGIRLGFISFAEQLATEDGGRADILHLMAFDRVRMLLNQCDHVIVLVNSGLAESELPLPQWRARYHRFIDVGASIVVDSGGARGWEAHQNGLVFYGLGSPAGADSLGLFLSLRRNGRLTYEVRALQRMAGVLALSGHDQFKEKIDAQNRLMLDEKAYQAAVDQMCLRLYCQSELAQKRGVLGLLTAHADEEARLAALLENESLRLVALRALRLLKTDDRHCREITKKA